MANKAAKKRRIYITYGIFAVVLLSLVLYIALRKSDRMQYGLPVIVTLEEEAISTVSIMGGTGESIVIARSGDLWLTEPEGYKVNPDLAKAMSEAIDGFRITDLVSTSGHYDRYELDDARAMVISAEATGGELFAFYMGKRAPSYNHTYVKFDGDSNVYHAATDLRRTFDKSMDDLRDKNVLAFSKDEVIRIGVAMPGIDFQLYKSTSEVSTSDQSAGSTAWTASDGSEWADEKVIEFVDRIDDLSCSEFIAEAGIDLGTPQLTVQIHTQDQHTLTLFDKDETGYRAKSSQTPFPFYLSDWQGDSILETFGMGDTDDQ